MTYTLYQGDCLEIMPKIPTMSIDCIIADPPYSINSKSDGSGKLNPWADRVNSAFWYKEWMGQCRRILKPSGCMWSFLNWRSMVTFQKAADDLAWPIESLLIWDKCWIGPGGSKGLRPSYEMVALWAGDSFSIKNRGLADIQRFKWSSIKPTGHPAEKPVDLLRWLIRECTNPGDVIVDPFMGSGTTGTAAIGESRSFIGIEIDGDYCEMSKRRIEGSTISLFPQRLPHITVTHMTPDLYAQAAD